MCRVLKLFRLPFELGRIVQDIKLNKTKVRYILRQDRKGAATEDIARDVKVSQRRVQLIIKEYKETGQEPVFGEKVGRPRKPFIEKEAEVIRTAHACYRFGARMLETVIRKQFTVIS
jgi:putative transposase